MKTHQEASLNIRQLWEQLQSEEGDIRIRNAAERLGVSELELLSTKIDESVTRLKIDNWGYFYSKLKDLGRVMVLTRNDHVVHEKTGEYATIDTDSHNNVGITTDGEIELRLLFRQWRHSCSVIDGQGKKIACSFQFFDAHGTAVHNVYLSNEAGIPAFNHLTSEYAATDQSSMPSLEAKPDPQPEETPPNVDVAALREAWQNLNDIHAFNAMLSKFGLTRVPALKLAGEPWGRQIVNKGLRLLFEKLSASGLPIMIFVSNPGCTQIHSGPVKKLVDYGTWFNVLDPSFNLHLNKLGIASAWVVTKRAKDQDIRSLELFDASGNTMIQVFGVSQQSNVDSNVWNSFLDELPDEES